MKKYIPLVLLMFYLFTNTNVEGQSVKRKTSDLTSYVDPYIGTGLHGHVFLGANVPFGAQDIIMPIQQLLVLHTRI